MSIKNTPGLWPAIASVVKSSSIYISFSDMLMGHSRAKFRGFLAFFSLHHYIEAWKRAKWCLYQCFISCTLIFWCAEFSRSLADLQTAIFEGFCLWHMFDHWNGWQNQLTWLKAHRNRTDDDKVCPLGTFSPFNGSIFPGGFWKPSCLFKNWSHFGPFGGI